MLRGHVCVCVCTCRAWQVAKFCEVLNKELTQRKKTADLPVSDTTGMSYASVLEEELGRNMKRAPLAFYAAVPTTLLEPAALAPSFPGWDLSTGQA
jgi:U3 small nucleolar RNA-associated protein 19